MTNNKQLSDILNLWEPAISRIQDLEANISKAKIGFDVDQAAPDARVAPKFYEKIINLNRRGAGIIACDRTGDCLIFPGFDIIHISQAEEAAMYEMLDSR